MQSLTPTSAILEKMKSVCISKKNTMEQEEDILPLVMDYLTPNMKHELECSLKETEHSRREGLQRLRELLKKEKNLYYRDEDIFLLSFLRARKYDVKKAFSLLQNYYGVIRDYPNIYVNDKKLIAECQAVYKKNYIGFLGSRDKFGSAVLIIKFELWNPDEDSFIDTFRALCGAVTHAIDMDVTQVTGFRAIIDVRKFTWKHVKNLTLKNIAFFIRATQFCFPGRYKSVHVVGETKLIDVLWSLCSSFLSRKLRSRIHFHGNDVEVLKNFVDSTVLPVEYGGHGPEFDNEDWYKDVRHDASRICDMLKYGYKRSAKEETD